MNFVDTHGIDELDVSNWTWIDMDAMQQRQLTLMLAADLDGN